MIYSQDGLRWIDLASEETHRIPGEVYGRHPTTNTSGTRVFFRSTTSLFPGADSEIMAIDLDGSNPARLTNDDFIDEKPVVEVVECLWGVALLLCDVAKAKAARSS